MQPSEPSTANCLAIWNDKIMPLKEVMVPALDRGFLFGDGVYEVVRVYNRSFFRLEDHMERLEKSLASIKLKNIDLDHLKNNLDTLKNKSGLDDALVYCQITRGIADRAHHYPSDYRPNILAYIQEFKDPYSRERREGAKAVTFNDIRWKRNDIKAISLIANCMAASYAKENDCLEVIFINHSGHMTEGSHTSIFGIKDGKLLVAPSSSAVLPGITKRQVLEIAEEIQLPVEETLVKKEDIHSLDELFLSGTPEEIVPIVEVDDRKIGDGTPGPLVHKLHQQFRKILGDIGYGAKL